MTETALDGTPQGPKGRRLLGGRARRAGLTLFFAAVAVNAALGIYAVLAPDFGDAEGKVLATSLCVTGAVVVALACEPAWERDLLGPVPAVTTLLGTAGFALVLVGIWAEPDDEVWGRLVGTAFTLTAAGVVASLLALARLAPRRRWVLLAALALLAVAAALVVGIVWTDDPAEWYVRVLGVALIALAAVVVTVPVLHWVDRAELAATEGAAAGEVGFCPFCGRTLHGAPAVELVCRRCGRAFSVRTGEQPGPRATARAP
jgi:hypothetical protein